MDSYHSVPGRQTHLVSLPSTWWAHPKTCCSLRPSLPRSYKHLVGREAVVPQSGRRIKIIADEYVDREFGTGALKITPGVGLGSFGSELACHVKQCHGACGHMLLLQ